MGFLKGSGTLLWGHIGDKRGAAVISVFGLEKRNGVNQENHNEFPLHDIIYLELFWQLIPFPLPPFLFLSFFFSLLIFFIFMIWAEHLINFPHVSGPYVKKK